MFSEYASRYSSKSQRPVPLFNRQSTGDSDVDDHIEAMSDSSEEGSESSEPASSSMHSESDSDDNSNNDMNPPSDLLIERPKHKKKKSSKHKTGYSLWKRNVEEWTRGTRSDASSSLSPPEAGPSNAPANGNNHIPTHSDHVEQISNNQSRMHGDLEAGLRKGKPLDNTVAAIYLLSMAFSSATAVLVSLTAPPNNGAIYPIFAYSARSLVVCAVLSCCVSTLWLFMMRRFTTFTITFLHGIVPATLAYAGFHAVFLVQHRSVGWHGMAHAAIRIAGLSTFAAVALNVSYLRRHRDVSGKATDLIVLATEVYNECSPSMTVLAAFSGLVSLVVTGAWSFFLARAFLDGRLGIVLGIWFTFMYFWTWGVLCASSKAILTNITVEWYLEHSMKNVLGNSIYEGITYHFSSACLSAFVALIIKIPLLLLPSQSSRACQTIATTFLSSPTTSILNPSTLPTAVVNRSSLNSAAHLVISPEFASLYLRPYRFAKFLLVAARVGCTISIGSFAWLHADHIEDASSAYGYLVAVIALFIGWTVMGASEIMLSTILDALSVNFVINDDSPKRDVVKSLFYDFQAETPAANANMLESEYSGTSSQE